MEKSPAKASFISDSKRMDLLRTQAGLPSRGECTIRDNLSFGVSIGRERRTGSAVFQFNEDRFRHMIVLGRTGSGKSNHVQQMEREDIRNGAGCFILASHEEDALYPLSCVPDERLEDVVFIDASNPEYLPCMNPLDINLNDPTARDKVISDVIELVTMDCPYDWAGPRFETLMRNGLGLILEPGYPFQRELAELALLYTDPDHVREALKYCRDRHIYDQWTKVEPDARRSSDYGEVIQWFLSKMSRFSDDHVLRHVFGAGRSTISVQEVIDEGKILIAAIPESRIGSVAAGTLGKWLAMQLRDAVMSRRLDTGGWRGLDYGLYEHGGEAVRPIDPFFVYVDEFSRHANADFEVLLAEARKRHVGFVLSFQTLSQTRTLNRKTGQVGMLEEAILGNVGSVICYPVGVKDARLLSEHLGLPQQDLCRIERYAPLVQLCMDNERTRPFSLLVPLRPKPDNPSAPRRVAHWQYLAGLWTPLKDAPEKGGFFEAIGVSEQGLRN